ncbi:MAG TPA: type I DNA topoisomerase [Bacillota bacterium]|nr:type I DNA topoisomerase [Bacillota bacterium]
MSDYLVIVESPAKARTIEKYIGKQYTVRASMGHLRDLPKSQLGVDLEDGFTPKYITIRGKGDLLKELRQLAKKAKRVYLATDPDREGEAISWHLATALDVSPEAPCRVTFNEITRTAVKKAFQSPREIDMARVDAQQARRVLDRIVGYKLSPLLWQKVRKGLSAGRVQSVAVKIIADRDREIDAFVVEEYWSINSTLKGEKGKSFDAKLTGVDICDEAAADTLIRSLTGRAFMVQSVKKAKRERRPAPPFTTSTLQQEAARKLGFTAKRTMRVAQSLYEGVDLGKEGAVGLITYMRTDSTRLSPEAIGAAAGLIKAQFGDAYHEPRQFAGRGNAQDAHEAIRPTYISRNAEQVQGFLSKDQYRLYKLIYERFLASQMASAVFDTVAADIAAGGYVFRAHGVKVAFPGFMALYSEGTDDDENEKFTELPDLREGEQLKLVKLTPRQHFTEPPPRYTEASLVKILEEQGIGRPSTYAPIIDTIQARGYVVKDKKRFLTTELGFVVVDILAEYFPEIVDVQFTAKMEADLDRVECENVPWAEVVGDFYKPFAVQLENAFNSLEKREIAAEVTDELCDLCGRNMVIKSGRFGDFLACPGFPECRNTKPILKETGATCPLCGGAVVERRSKRGRVFYGCSSYPGCNFVVWNKPSRKKCPVCGSFTTDKKGKDGKVVHTCANPQCTVHEHKGKKNES